jgi:hypothetical protein
MKFFLLNENIVHFLVFNLEFYLAGDKLVLQGKNQSAVKNSGYIYKIMAIPVFFHNLPVTRGLPLVSF